MYTDKAVLAVIPAPCYHFVNWFSFFFTIHLKTNAGLIFKVNVIKVNTINLKGKNKIVQGRKAKKSGYKKAIITLKKGQSIDLSTGI